MPAASMVEDVYPLSHMQAGMLFHCRYAPESEAYFEQVSCAIRGQFDVALFERAWSQVVSRHAVLRSGFDWEELDLPVQVVFRAVAVPLHQHDLRHLHPELQGSAIESLLTEDRNRRFDLSKPPLMRLMLIRLSEDVYRFVWSHHHILLDGWSVAIVAKEVFAIYETLCRGLEARMEAVRPYRDYIAWLGSIDDGREESYWRHALSGAPSLRQERRPEVEAAALAAKQAHHEFVFSLTREETAALTMFARRQRVTLNTLVQGALGIVLGRYDGMGTELFGVTVSGRPAEMPQVESMVGMFMNTLPLKIDMPPDEPLVPWLQNLDRVQREIAEHGYASLADIQKWSGVPPSRPLFGLVLIFENYPLSIASQRIGGGAATLTVDDVRSFERTSYPLTVMVVPKSEMSFTFVHNRRWHAADSIQRMAGHLRTVLLAMVERPDRLIGEITILSEVERHQAVLEWNDTERTVPPGSLLSCFIEEQVARTPDGIAAVFSDGHVTYAELNRRADALARRLAAARVGPDVIVGVFLERSIELPIALLAILKAGGAYLPLEPTHPPHYLVQMLDDSRPLLILSTAKLAHAVPAGCGRVILVEPESESRLDEVRAPATMLDEANLAYVIYTSGSTGKPKGAMISHQGICNRLCWMQEIYSLSGHDRVLQKTPFHFDVSVWELFWPLMTGACMVLAEPGGHLDEGYLSDLIAREQITMLHFVPSLLQRFLECDLSSCTSLAHVIASGEPLPAELERRFFERLGARLHNLYGPTEASVDVTAWECGRNSTRLSVPLGRPISNIRIQVVDRMLAPVPVGISGQLTIGGVGLARGYLNCPDLTGEKFIPDPLGKHPGSRRYLTGDQARQAADGLVEYIGRLDQQIKIHGVRIELGEIESALLRHPAVREGIAVLQRDRSGDRRIVGYVICHRHADRPTEDDLRRSAYRHLPRSAVPGAFVVLDAFPLLSNGKVDRAALPVPRPEPVNDEGQQRKHSQISELVAAVWSSVLNVERVGVEDDFFSLGGHSILAMQMVSRVRELFRADILLSDVFEAPMLMQFAARVDAALRIGFRDKATPAEAIARDEFIPLSFSQERLWFLDRLSPGDPAFHIVSAIRFKGELDTVALEQSLQEIIRRHQVLRTVFPLRNEKPVQKILPRLTVPVSKLDLVTIPDNEKQLALSRLIGDEAKRCFSLAEGPLLRAHLVKLDHDEHVGLFVVQHIVFDAWSVAIFNRELGTIYRAFSAGQVSPLAELRLQYADIAHQQHLAMRGDVLATLIEYWKGKLAGAVPPVEIPTDFPRPARPSSLGGNRSFHVPKDVVAGLESAYRHEGVTLFMILLGAFKVLLHQLTSNDRIVVGTDIATRGDEASEAVIGCFLNQVVLFTQIDATGSFRELLRKVRITTLDALAHRDLPFEKLVEVLNPPRELAHSPLFQVKIVLLNVPQSDLKLPGLELSPLYIESEVSEFDILLVLEERDGQVNGTMKYRKELFAEHTITRVVEMYVGCLRELANHPEASLASLKNVLTAMDRRFRQRMRAEREQQNKQSLIGKLRSAGP